MKSAKKTEKKENIARKVSEGTKRRREGRFNA